MNRDGIADPRHLGAPEAPGRGEAHLWRVVLPTDGARAAARHALREILGAYLRTAPESMALVVGEHGKPALAGAPISFNLSHSGGLALVAVVAPGTEVGIDVERVRPRRDLARLAERWLPPEDAKAVAEAAGGKREQLFYDAWTRHEARTKCTGAGLSGPPPSPDIVAIPLEIDRGYAAALATDIGPPLRLHRMNP
ncbi:MAG: 4'-phosphopantetheinyl transferase superfamily protein [Actinobacteria bacterium]|nr:4'-phosphopantetheinyl transferase superfamily protein [Actinomycetota bacterium]